MRTAMILIPLALAGCDTIATPRRCEQAALGLNTIEQLTALFVNFGGSAETARKLADAVALGRMGRAAACAQLPAPVSP